MIHYKRGGWHFLFVLIRLSGSVIPRTIPIALFSALIAFVLIWFGVPESIISSPVPFQFWLQVVALVLAFHINSAYQRFWEARTNLQSVASYWGDAISHLVAFDELTMLAKSVPTCEADVDDLQSLTSTIGEWKGVRVRAEFFEDCIKFRAYMLHMFSLLHTVCIQYLLNKDGRDARLEVLGGVIQKEALDLERSPDQAFLVSHRITQGIARRHILEQGLPIGGPVLSRTWQLMYLGMQSYNQSCKIEDTPFPFPYIQLMYFLDASVALLAPVVIATYTPSIPLAMILSFLTAFCYHSLFLASYLMETPFGRRPNDLPLLELHADFIARLKSLVDKHTAEALREMTLESTGIADTLELLKFASWPVSQSPLLTDPTIYMTSPAGFKRQATFGLSQTTDLKNASSFKRYMDPLFTTLDSRMEFDPNADLTSDVDIYAPTILSSEVGLPPVPHRRIGAPSQKHAPFSQRRIPTTRESSSSASPVGKDSQKEVEQVPFPCI